MNILAVIGTVNPGHPEIFFISSADVIKEEGINRLLEIVRSKFGEYNPATFKEAMNSVFNKDNIFVNKDVKNKFEAIKILTDNLVNKGCVSPNFIKGVLEREEMGSTVVGTTLTIPHGNSEDIIFPAIGVMTLKNPVEWFEGIKISLVFLLALNESSKNEFQRVYRIIKNQDIAKKLRMAKSASGVFDIVENIY